MVTHHYIQLVDRVISSQLEHFWSSILTQDFVSTTRAKLPLILYPVKSHVWFIWCRPQTMRLAALILLRSGFRVNLSVRESNVQSQVKSSHRPEDVSVSQQYFQDSVRFDGVTTREREHSMLAHWGFCLDVFCGAFLYHFLKNILSLLLLVWWLEMMNLSQWKRFHTSRYRARIGPNLRAEKKAVTIF